MPLSSLMKDQVSLIKPSGERHDGIRASVQREKIFIDDGSLIIEPGDCIERVASNGLQELFEVVDPGFYERTAGIPAHYQLSVRRVKEPPKPEEEPAAGEPEPGLHPWGPISTMLFELDSDEVVDLTSLGGLAVDWSLSGKEGYSHSTRKRAYRPRLESAFHELNEADALRVAWVVASELVKRHPDGEDGLRERLGMIGWTIDGGGIHPSSAEVAELFFPTGSEHDAYVKLRDIVQSAEGTVTIVDPYVDSSLLTVLGTSETRPGIRILSHKLSADFELEAKKFVQQYKPQSFEVRKTREFHDRFIILDGSRCYHVGASIKDAGLRAFMVSQVQDPENVRALLKQVEDSWNNAS